MKDTYLVWLVIFGIVWGLAVFSGYLAGLKKNLFKPQIQSSQPEKIRSHQSQFAQESEEERKKLMERLRQKAEDNRKGF